MKSVARSLRSWTGLPPTIFGVAFATGVAGLLSLKILEAGPALVIVWPVVVMVAYASLVWAPAFKLRADQTGDNVYYLGFLFTLVSLGYTLFRFTVEAGVDDVVQNFGVAISSTIGGVALRVLLNQMRTDPYDTERQTRLALVESSRNLRDELDASTLEFNAFRRQSQQAIIDAMRELRDIAAEQLESSSKRLEQTVQSTTTQIETVIGAWSGHAATFNDRSSALVEAISELSTKLEAVRAPASIIEEKIEPAAIAIAGFADIATASSLKLNDAVSHMSSGAHDISLVVGGARDALEHAREHAEALKQANGILDAAKLQLERVDGQLAMLDASSDSYQRSLSLAANELSASLVGFMSRLEVLLADHNLAGGIPPMQQRTDAAIIDFAINEQRASEHGA